MNQNNKSPRFLGVITARGGSKGIINKNIKLLAGKPLIFYTIKESLASELDRVIVSTDSPEIAEVASKYGADVPFLRPDNLAGDSSSSIDVIKHSINWLKDNENQNYDYVMILQPTSPLRTKSDINNCIKLAKETGSDSVMSMFKLSDFSLKKLKKISNDGVISHLIEPEGKNSARRDEEKNIYKRNAAIYLTRVVSVMNNDLFGEVSRAYVMPPERSVDINNQLEFDLAEFLLNNNKK